MLTEWKETLHKKVGDVVLEAEIYKMIWTCLEQPSENLFEDCLSGLLNYLESEPKAVCFRNYFVWEWVNKKTQRAYYFRLHIGINTNMFSEAFYRVFKRVYLGGKTNKHIDNCLVNLVKFSHHKAFDRGIKLQKQAAWVILNADISERIELLFRQLDWLPLKEELNPTRSSLIFSRIKDENACPSYITELLTRNSDRHTRTSGYGKYNLVCPSYNREKERGKLSKPVEQNWGTASL